MFGGIGEGLGVLYLCMKITKRLVAIVGVELMVAMLIVALVYVNWFGGESERSGVRGGGDQNVTGEQVNEEGTSQNDDISRYILADYPADVVPLVKDVTVSSMKYFVQDYSGLRQNYYNVVFYTDLDAEDVVEFYRKKMDRVTEDEAGAGNARLEGTIGDYRVVLSNYGSRDFYLEVHMPSQSFTSKNRYYDGYPKLVELGNDWLERESTYGLLNQNGGQVEYTQWFEVDVSEYPKNSEMRNNPIGTYYEMYREKYGESDGFNADDTERILRWQDGDYSVWLAFSVDHGRVYLTFRKGM